MPIVPPHCAPTTIGNAIGGKEGRGTVDYCFLLFFLSSFFVETKGDVVVGGGGCRVDIHFLVYSRGG